MFIKENEDVNIVFTSKVQITKWGKKFGFYPKLNEEIKVCWKFLKTTKFRTLFINLKCDGDKCEKIFPRRIRDLDTENNIHFCKNCAIKGNKNGMFGKKMHDNTKISLKKFRDENANPFTWKSTKDKIKDANVWEKIAKKNTGKTRTDETKKLQSKSALLAFKEGRRVPCKRWGKTLIKQYKGIDYQSSYELKFLQIIDEEKLLDYIERGPIIEYIDKQNKMHNYFVDYKLKNTNIVFEIKSTFIWKKNLEINLIKKEATEKIYKFVLIMDNKFNKLKKMLKEYDKKL